jgi:hypothetical protein
MISTSRRASCPPPPCRPPPERVSHQVDSTRLVDACVGDASYRLMMRACRQLINAAHGRPGRFVEPSMNQAGVDPLHRHFCWTTASSVLVSLFLLESCKYEVWQQAEPIQSSVAEGSGSYVRRLTASYLSVHEPTHFFLPRTVCVEP